MVQTSMYWSGTTEKLLVQQTPLGELKQTSQKVHCFLQPHIDKATTAPALQLSPAGDQTLGLTPVLVAASFGQTKALEFLKSVGADLNLARVDGATALDLALDQEHSETAAWLEQNGVARVLA
ncbi:Ankyrin repeat and SOCS box protein 2 (ASB-2) [Durusdinium trenchii]|uniref:Ankyrin repeat and SOCS box protein 2 (ASB-2) n=1 Tax=Durusdinium trenchii TaxID=1381693 RepID=A0ABP0LZ18_9DINO